MDGLEDEILPFFEKSNFSVAVLVFKISKRVLTGQPLPPGTYLSQKALS